jgi:hypothetical protein
VLLEPLGKFFRLPKLPRDQKADLLRTTRYAWVYLSPL